ncbi:MAG TPA: sigma-70 family RNA polymerase sigma factor [Candidatus Udaeobacter sp.]
MIFASLDLDYGVDDWGSPSATHLGAQNGAVAFATTHWSVVLEAQGQSPAAQEALGKLCRTYWRPVYSFIRRQGAGPEEAEDLTQGFFALLLERRDLETVRREKGRLRSYLLVSLKHFLTNERSRAMTIKRGEGRRLVPLDALGDHEGMDLAPADTLSADQIYERRWALTVLEEVLARLSDEYRAAGNAGLFDGLKKLLTDEPDRPSQAKIGHEFGMSENAVKQAFHRLRRRYRELLHEEIAHTVIAPGDIEDELRHLVAVLRA